MSVAAARMVGRRAAAALGHASAQKEAFALVHAGPKKLFSARFPASRGIFYTRQCSKDDPSGGVPPGDDPPNDVQPSGGRAGVDSSTSNPTRVDLPSVTTTGVVPCGGSTTGGAPSIGAISGGQTNASTGLICSKPSRNDVLSRSFSVKPSGETPKDLEVEKATLEAIRVEQDRVGKEQAEEKSRQEGVRGELERVALWQNATRVQLEAAEKDIKRREDEADMKDDTVKVVLFDKEGGMKIFEVAMKKDEAESLSDLLKRTLQGCDKEDKEDKSENEGQGGESKKTDGGSQGDKSKKSDGEETGGSFKWRWWAALMVFPVECLFVHFFEDPEEEKPKLDSDFVFHVIKDYLLEAPRKLMKAARQRALSKVILKCELFSVFDGVHVKFAGVELNSGDIELLKAAHKVVMAKTRGKGNLKTDLFIVIDGKIEKLATVQIRGSETQRVIAAYLSTLANASPTREQQTSYP